MPLPNLVTTAAAIGAHLKKHVIQQDTAIDLLAEDLQHRFEQRRSARPLATYLIAGAPGVGKTELGKRLAEAAFSDPERSVICCGPHLNAGNIFGSLWRSASQRCRPTASISQAPARVVLIDEFQHASNAVKQRLASIWNAGVICDDLTKQVHSLEDTIFVMTTNAGGPLLKTLFEPGSATDDEIERGARAAFKKSEGWGIGPIIDLIDRVIVLRPLRGRDAAPVVARGIERLAHSYAIEIAVGANDLRILIEAIERIGKDCLNTDLPELSRLVETEIANDLIDAKAGGAKVIRIVGEPSRLRVMQVA